MFSRFFLFGLSSFFLLLRMPIFEFLDQIFIFLFIFLLILVNFFTKNLKIMNDKKFLIILVFFADFFISHFFAHAFCVCRTFARLHYSFHANTHITHTQHTLYISFLCVFFLYLVCVINTVNI